MRIRLADVRRLPRTNREDSLEYYRRPLARIPYIHRLKGVARLMGGRRFRALLDVGYGTGIFFPELARRADSVYGIDVHERGADVREALRAQGVYPQLCRASIRELPFRGGSFDAVLVMSVLIYFDEEELASVFREITRVLSSGGRLYLGFSVSSKLRNMAYRALGYTDYANVYKSDHRAILAVARRRLEIETIATYPSLLPPDYALFAFVSARRREEEGR